MSKLVEIEKQYKTGCVGKETYINLMHKRHLMLEDYPKLIKNKNVAAIEISQGKIILKTKDGVSLFCDFLDKRHISMEILNFGNYESAELQMIKRFLKKDSVILDIGANIGWYSINLSRSVPRGRIIAFEPIPKTYNCLIKNVALNQLPNIKAYNIGLFNKSGRFNFYYNRSYTGATSLKDIIHKHDTVLIKCRVEKLDDFLKKIKIGQVDFIKCDAEGAEKFVIEGGLNLIKKYKPVIFVELLRKWAAKFDYHPNSVISLLKQIGYECYVINKAKLKKIREITETTQQTNFYFLPVSKYSKLLSRLT
ncbi:MAG: FkbM family methyltransferase [Candidatus Omnitrophica bacterium]|nr:FkbM family methyltransferase [Candidatus Omnitrophota bacterium]